MKSPAHPMGTSSRSRSNAWAWPSSAYVEACETQFQQVWESAFRVHQKREATDGRRRKGRRQQVETVSDNVHGRNTPHVGHGVVWGQHTYTSQCLSPLGVPEIPFSTGVNKPREGRGSKKTFSCVQHILCRKAGDYAIEFLRYGDHG